MVEPVPLPGLSSVLRIPKLHEYIGEVEKTLESLVQRAAEPIRQPALRVLRGGGKRLRPALVIAAGLCQGGKINDDLIASATAIEFLHLGSLVHDDILDHAASRWNRPTVFSQDGQNVAILVGDYFLAQAAAVAASVNGTVAATIAQTIITMCEGQSLESASLFNLKRTAKNYYEATNQKTAAVFASACQIGAMGGKLPPRQLNALTDYGQAFGMAFQLTDDLLDLVADGSLVNKPVGNDIKEGTYTLPIVDALQGPMSFRLQQLIQKSVDTHDTETIIALLKESGSLDRTIKQIKTSNQQATDALKVLKPSQVVDGLADLPDYYWRWAKQKVAQVHR